MSKRYGRRSSGGRPSKGRRPAEANAPRELDPETAEERREVSRAIGAAYRGLRALRTLCIVDAVILGLLLLLVLDGDSLLAKVIIGGLFLCAVTCAVYVVRSPLASCIAMACLHTPPAIMAKTYLGYTDIVGFTLIGLCLLLWMTVTMARNTQKLVRAYPDVWAAKSVSGRGRRSDEMGSKWQDRSRELRRKQIQQVLLFGVLPLVLLIVGLSVIGKDESSDAGSPSNPYPLEKPTEPLAPTVERFEAAWNGSRHDDVKAFVSVSERTSRWATLDKMGRKYDWQETLPRATDRRLERHNDSQWLSFHKLEGYGEIRIWWEWERTKWVIVRWQFKKVRD